MKMLMMLAKRIYQHNNEYESLLIDDDYSVDNCDDSDNDEDYDTEKNDDYENYENDDDVDVDNSDDDGISSSTNQQNASCDLWQEGIEIDPNDPTLAKDQQLTLAVLIKCRKLINMIRKSSILILYFNRQSETLKITRNLLRDICIVWNSSYMMIDSLIIVRPIIDKLYHDKHYLNINCNQIEKSNRLEITSGE